MDVMIFCFVVTVSAKEWCGGKKAKSIFIIMQVVECINFHYNVDENSCFSINSGIEAFFSPSFFENKRTSLVVSFIFFLLEQRVCGSENTKEILFFI